MSKKEVLQKFHKEAIATAADRLFAKYGIEKSTMEDIAKEAEYSKATLYVYFKSKDEIYYYIVLKYMENLLEQMTTAIKTTTNALQQYKMICDGLALFISDHPNYYPFLSATIAVDKKSQAKMPVLSEIYDIGEKINDCSMRVLENGVKQGYFREDIDISLTVLMVAASIPAIAQWANNKTEYIKLRTGASKDVFLTYCFDTLLRGVLKGEAGGSTNESQK